MSIQWPIKISENVQLGGRLQIGRYSYIGPNSNLRGNIQIGCFFLCADNVVLAGGDHDYSTIGVPLIYGSRAQMSMDTIIGHDVWIGRNVTIMRGIRIGDCAIVGAGSVVTKHVCQGHIVGGVPAVQIGQRFSDKEIATHLSLLQEKFRM